MWEAVVFGPQGRRGLPQYQPSEGAVEGGDIDPQFMPHHFHCLP